MTDGNAYAIDRYLASFDDEIGTYDGDPCNRFEQIDEDAPRGYRPRRCTGVMIEDDGEIVCDTCGELA